MRKENNKSTPWELEYELTPEQFQQLIADKIERARHMHEQKKAFDKNLVKTLETSRALQAR